MNFDPLRPRLPVGDWASDFLDWFQGVFGFLIDVIKLIIGGAYDGLVFVLAADFVPFWLMMLVLSALAWWASGWKLAVFTFLGFYLIRALDQWVPAMQTMSLVVIAVLIAIALAVPLGIMAAKVQTVSTVVKPVLDFMQSMPALAYLVPAIALFSIGPVPGIIATIIFSMPPGVRLTELAIRQVDTEVVEAAQAFGATPGAILARIQIPLALPTIMAGINQVIMLALSMVVLAGMVGAQGLGGGVVEALNRVNVGLGVEAGLAVVIIAVFLDRVTAALGNRSPLAKALKAAS